MAIEEARPVVLIGITASISEVLIRGQLSALRDCGYDVHLVSSPGKEVEALAAREKLNLHPVEMARAPHLLSDLVALWTIWRLVGQLRPRIVNAGTPKAGLLLAVASLLRRVPVRIYTLRGFRYESESGLYRWMLIQCEKLVSAMCQYVICISPSVKERGLQDDIFPVRKAVVLGQGSSNGLDLRRFDPTLWSDHARARVREEWGFGPEHLVVGFVGRLVPRKGINELLQAWPVVRDRHPSARLFLIGPGEVDHELPSSTIAAMNGDPTVVVTGYQADIPRLMAALDIFTLPSHWEGFGNVLIEAASMGVPVVSTNATGTRDAVDPNGNGLCVPPKDVVALAEALIRYIEDPQLRKRHGAHGRLWAARFGREEIWAAQADFYAECQRNAGLRPPQAREILQGQQCS